MNNLRAVTCPKCKGKRGWCEECYGSGLVTLRERPIYMPKWGAIIAALAVIGALLFVGWKIVDALPRFIEAWR